MRVMDRLYSLALRTYPAAFRREQEEEILATLAEAHEAGEPRRHIRQLVSLLLGGNRQRWLCGTDGSLVATVRQGLAWGVLVLVARQAGLAVYDLVQPFIRGWGEPFALTYLLLALGWIATFGLLASGRRKWGLALLAVVTCGFVYDSVQFALSYPGRFSWPFTLRFFLPMVLPLLAACAWPAGGVKVPARWWAPILVLAVLVPPISMLFGPFSSFFGFVPPLPYVAVLVMAALAAAITAIMLVLSWSDPRWAVAAALALSVFGGKALLSLLFGGDLVDAGLQILVLWIFAPAVAVGLARRAKRPVRA
jgi:hypothetical protein